MKEYLRNGIEKIGIEYKDECVDKLIEYFKYLIEYNKHTNLTAIRDEKDALEKHFLDSLLLQRFIANSDGEKIIDIGTGAGFPGMVLAIYNPNKKFLLMDSVGKKTKFLEEVKNRLNLQNVTIENARAEDFIKKGFREYFDIGVCRGVNKLNVILEYMIPFLKVGGYFYAQKMADTGEEEEAKNALEILNSQIENIEILELPNYKDKRVVVKIKKMDKTNEKYPRRAGVALKKPL